MSDINDRPIATQIADDHYIAVQRTSAGRGVEERVLVSAIKSAASQPLQQTPVALPSLLEPVDFYGAILTDKYKSTADGNTYMLGRCGDSKYSSGNLAVNPSLTATGVVGNAISCAGYSNVSVGILVGSTAFTTAASVQIEGWNGSAWVSVGTAISTGTTASVIASSAVFDVSAYTQLRANVTSAGVAGTCQSIFLQCDANKAYRWSKNPRTPGQAPATATLVRDFSALNLTVAMGPYYYDDGLMVIETRDAAAETGTTLYQLWFSWDQGANWTRYNVGQKYNGSGYVTTTQLLNKESLAVFKHPLTGQQMIVMGWYNTAAITSAPEIQIVVSFDKGRTFKTWYPWNLTSTNGDEDNRVRHIHSVIYNKITKCLYVFFGDGKQAGGIALDGVPYNNKQGILQIDMTQFSGWPSTVDLYLQDAAFNSGAFKTAIGDLKYRAVNAAIRSDGKMFYSADNPSPASNPSLYSGCYSFDKDFANFTRLSGDYPHWTTDGWNTAVLSDNTIIFTSQANLQIERGTITISAVNTSTGEVTFAFQNGKRSDINTGDLVWLTGSAAPTGATLTSGTSVVYYWLYKTGTNTAKLCNTPKHAEAGEGITLTGTQTGATVNFNDDYSLSVFASTDGVNVRKVGKYQLGVGSIGTAPQGIFELDGEIYISSNASSKNANKSVFATTVCRFSGRPVGFTPIPVLHPVYWVSVGGTDVKPDESNKGGFYPCTALASPQYLLNYSPNQPIGLGARVQLSAGTFTTPMTQFKYENITAPNILRPICPGEPLQIAGEGKDLTIWEHNTTGTYHFWTSAIGAAGSTAFNIDFINLHMNSAANAATTTERIFRLEAANVTYRMYGCRIGDGTGQYHHVQTQGAANQFSLLNGSEVITHQTTSSASAFYPRSNGHALEIKSSTINNAYRGIYTSDAISGVCVWDIDHAGIFGHGGYGIDISTTLNLSVNSKITNLLIASNYASAQHCVRDLGSGFSWSDTQVNNNVFVTTLATKVTPASVASTTDVVPASYAALQLHPHANPKFASLAVGNATASILGGRPSALFSYFGEQGANSIGPF